jgi:endonuclease/exonuclease/phosphatase family metal-dependent hydrolase
MTTSIRVATYNIHKCQGLDRRTMVRLCTIRSHKGAFRHG